MTFWQIFLNPLELLNIHRGFERLTLSHLIVDQAESSKFVTPVSRDHPQVVLFSPHEMISPFRVEPASQFLKPRCEIQQEGSVGVVRAGRLRVESAKRRLDQGSARRSNESVWQDTQEKLSLPHILILQRRGDAGNHLGIKRPFAPLA